MINKKLYPYRGESPYIFLSYSHKDLNEAMEIVNELQSNGYRVWYDEGIDPGTEWDENIATHVESCSILIALLSRNYLNSSNCKDELNYARDLEKPRLLIYLECIELPRGMQMRLSRLQAIHKYAYQDSYQFYEKLYSAQNINICCDQSNCNNSNSFFKDSATQETKSSNIDLSAQSDGLKMQNDISLEHNINASDSNSKIKHNINSVSKDFIIENGAIIKYTGKETSVIIPNNVFEIAERAFENNKQITKVVMPISVRIIGDSAFKGCLNLITLDMSDAIKIIGEHAFAGCSSLKAIDVPKKVSRIGTRALKDCSNLENINVAEENSCYSSVDGVLFSKGKSVLISYPIGNKRTSYTIPNSVSSISAYAFAECSNLTNVVIPENVTVIDKYAFAECINLKSITIPDSVIKIKEHAFEGCGKVKDKRAKEYM